MTASPFSRQTPEPAPRSCRYHLPMARWRTLLWPVTLALAGAAAARVAYPLYLWTLRGLYQLGERVGITAVPPAPGASLGGQVAGYNYARPPIWWGFSAEILSSALPLAIVFVAMLWCEARPLPAPRRPRAGSLLLAALAGAIAAGLIQRVGYSAILSLCIALGEALGGTVTRLSGAIGWGTGGPFSGSTWADTLGNHLTRWGPWVAPSLVGAILALILHARARRPLQPATCPACGYDRRGISPAGPCPECGGQAAKT